VCVCFNAITIGPFEISSLNLNLNFKFKFKFFFLRVRSSEEFENGFIPTDCSARVVNDSTSLRKVWRKANIK